MVLWHGKGLTLKEAADESSLCGQLNRIGLNIEANKRKGAPIQVISDKDAENQRRRLTDNAGGNQDRMPADSDMPPDDPGSIQRLPEAPPEAPPEASQNDNQDAIFTELERREFLMRTTRSQFSTDEFSMSNKYKDAFKPEAVYVSLLMQSQYVTEVAEKTRVDRVNPKAVGEKDSKIPSTVIPKLKYKSPDGVKMAVPPFAKQDYELSVSTNYCMSKRLLNPHEVEPLDDPESDPKDKVDMDSQNLHSMVRMGFCVYASEKEMFVTGGSKYTFVGGEGTGDVPYECSTDKNVLRNHRRANLYRYQTNEGPDFGLEAGDATDESISLDKRAHNIEVSSHLLEYQPRSLGHPLFETPFKAKASLFEVELNEKGIPDLSNSENASKYHVAMRYRFEVVRLWWKLFHHQQDAVIGMIKMLSLKTESRAFLGEGSIVDDLIDTTRPDMILAVTELGKTGMLKPGTIYPKYKQATERYDDKSNRNLFEIMHDPDDPNPPRVRNESEHRFTEPVQVYEGDTWPIVKIGMNGSWLDWIGVKNGINLRNNQAFSLMEAVFEKDLAVDYDTVFAEPTESMMKHERDVFSVFKDTTYRQAQFWNTFSVIAGDMMDSMPVWANAYLCDDLVTQTPDQAKNVAQMIEKLRAEVALKDTDLRHKMYIDSTLPTKTSKDLAFKEIYERKVYFARVKRAQKVEELKALQTHGSASSVVWRPYSSNHREERTSNDNDAPYSISWAQECLHRSILGVYSAGWNYEYYSVDKGISGQQQRCIDGVPFSKMEGERMSADFFRQWYDEVYSGKGDDGLALPGHQVVMNNLVDHGKPTLSDRPGTVQLQGHVARVISRTRRFSGGVALFPPYEYLLETHFDFSGTSDDDFNAAKNNNEVSPSGKIMIKLTDENIMPFSYTSPYRYGDAVELLAINISPEVDKNKRHGYYKKFGFNDDPKKQWIIADVPFLGPPSVLSASIADGGLGWGDLGESPSSSYLSAPSEHRAAIMTLGSLVLTQHFPILYNNMNAKMNAKDYMRWPPAASVSLENKQYYPINSFMEKIEFPEEIKDMDVYRINKSGQRLLRYSSHTLFKWNLLPHQKPEEDPEWTQQYKFDGSYR